MLDINLEFSKGILFVRLIGILNKSNEDEAEEKIVDIVDEGGIRYIVLNTEDLDISDDTTLFDRCNELIKDNNGKMLLCGKEDKLSAYNYDFVSDELSAFKLLTV